MRACVALKKGGELVLDIRPIVPGEYNHEVGGTARPRTFAAVDGPLQQGRPKTENLGRSTARAMAGVLVLLNGPVSPCPWTGPRFQRRRSVATPVEDARPGFANPMPSPPTKNSPVGRENRRHQRKDIESYLIASQ